MCVYALFVPTYSFILGPIPELKISPIPNPELGLIPNPYHRQGSAGQGRAGRMEGSALGIKRMESWRSNVVTSCSFNKSLQNSASYIISVYFDAQAIPL